jgi:NTE family protein
VLDRLLEEDDLLIPGIVGTSAGAMNAVLLAAGLADGGRTGAQELLRRFWTRVSKTPLFRLPLPVVPGFAPPGWFTTGSMAWVAIEAWMRLLSPYQFNPLNLNPLRDILEELVDFDTLRSGEPKLYLCATNMLTGKLCIFDRREIRVEHVLASACLPTLFQAVRIGSEYFWDGGYMGNPPIFPVIYNTACQDVLIVQINPISIDRVPTLPQDIADRMNTLSFNSSLQRELRAISFVSSLVEKGILDARRFKRLNIHVVEAEDVMRGLGALSKFDTDPSFIASLYTLGRERMAKWLTRHRGKIGRESSVDLRLTFL